MGNVSNVSNVSRKGSPRGGNVLAYTSDEVMAAIVDLINELDVSPTIDEIRAELASKRFVRRGEYVYVSAKTVARYLKRLEVEGRIERVGKVRGIVVNKT